VWSVVGLALPVIADEESNRLGRAIELFDAGEYLDAQELLLGLDRSRLSKGDQARRDDYLNRVSVALRMAEKAFRDMEDAEIALRLAAEGNAEQASLERDAAARLLEAVLANEDAPAPLRQTAQAKLQELTPHKPVGESAPPSDAPPPGEAPPPSEESRPASPTGGGQDAAEPPPAEAPAEQPPSPGLTSSDVERATTLTREAQEMVKSARYAEAEKLYKEALDLVPGFPEAVDGLAALQAHRENVYGTRSDSLIERMRQDYALNWQRAESEYRAVARDIHQLVSENRYDEAHQLLLRARQIVESARQYADPITRYESLRDELEALGDHVRQAERAYNEAEVARMREEITLQRTQRLKEADENRRREVEALMSQAQQHRKDGDYDAAITVLKQVTVIDPRYQPARWLMDDLDEIRQFRKQYDMLERRNSETQRTLMDVEESKIPWHKILDYPKDWLEIISRPERNRPGMSNQDSLLLGALDRRIPTRFQRVPFHQVMEHLADAQRINLLVNWNDLAAAGVERDVPIDLNLPNEITLKKAITEVLHQAGGEVELGYDVADGVVTVATQRFLARSTYPAVYDINDLLMEIPNFNDAPQTDLAKLNDRLRHQASAVDRAWQFGDDDDDEPERDPDRASRVQQIIEMIQTTVDPESWTDLGGTVGSLREINSQLVVTQNSAAHGRISDLLTKLREVRAVQIGVEARFLIVSSHYLEEFGIDLDIVLNAQNAGYDFVSTGISSSPIASDPVLGSPLLLPRGTSRLGFAPNPPILGAPLTLPGGGVAAPSQPYTHPILVPGASGGSGRNVTPVPIRNSVSQFTDPAGITHDLPGSFAGQTVGPAMSLFGSFLDNIQVDFLIRATQADSRNTVLTAPRLVLFNGQRSWVAVTIQTAFVSQLIPQVNTGAAAQAPQIGTINAGAVLDVQGVVSADKRYVTMNLRPGITRLNELLTFQTSGGGTAGDAFIQLPSLSSQLIKTTVSVPDGGTLLIGGQKLAAETEVEAGVPVLSKIPILKRLYSSKTMVKDEQTLLILIKPTIFIQSEQEELAFPSFGRR
jgi:general secretion pathway protein D